MCQLVNTVTDICLSVLIQDTSNDYPFVCLSSEFYNPVNTVKVMMSQSVNLVTDICLFV